MKWEFGLSFILALLHGIRKECKFIIKFLNFPNSITDGSKDEQLSLFVAFTLFNDGWPLFLFGLASSINSIINNFMFIAFDVMASKW